MPSSVITAAERIRELSVINADVALLVKHAGEAINALTNRTVQNSNNSTELGAESAFPSIDERRDIFTEHTKAYYSGLQAVIARLRRQAYALEEAGIITAEQLSLGTGAGPAQNKSVRGGVGRAQASAPQEPDRITNGGLGNLDVGWLNSRGNKVGAEKEAELFEEAKTMLQEALNK